MQLNYKIFGDGKPVIIMHGLFGMLDNWRSIAKNLETSYQCILTDLRNHGRSPRSEVMNYQVMADDIVAMMDELNIPSAAIVGHSMGGKVAMQVALAHPKRINKLVVIDIAPKRYPPHHHNVIKAIEAIDPATMSERSEAEQIFRDHLRDNESTIQFLLKNISRTPHGHYEWKANMPVLIGNYDILMGDISGTGSFTNPTLFIKGSDSELVDDDDRGRIRILFPASQIVTVKNAGHWVHADQPAALTEILNTFLES